MLKTVFCLHRLPHLSVTEFQHYWHDVHAPLVHRHRTVLRIARYVQFHSDLGPLADKLRAFRGSPAPYDGIARAGRLRPAVRRRTLLKRKRRPRGAPFCIGDLYRGLVSGLGLAVRPARCRQSSA